ncbi:MAG: hypothetical protein ACQES8_07985 [Thermodesulfobacteriota bacterium]
MTYSDRHHFVVCVRNDDYSASLEKRKIYEILPDPELEKHHQVRIIDESGEDYIYPEEYFVSLELPKETEEAVVHAANA